MKICPNCQKEYDDIASFCTECGVQLVELQFIEEQKDVETFEKYCMNCGNQLTETAVFCPACGTPAKAVNNGAVNTNINVNDYINKIKTNKNVTGFVDMMKKYFANPASALNKAVTEGNVSTTIISSVALLISIIIFFLCFVGKINSEFYGGFEEMLGLGMIVAVFMAVFFVLVPAVTTFAAVKLNGKEYDFKGILLASSVNTLYLVPAFILSGLISFASLEAGIVLFVIAVIMKIFLSISMLNSFAGNILESVKTLWASIGIATILNAIAIAICGSILGDVLENIIYDLIYSFMW